MEQDKILELLKEAYVVLGSYTFGMGTPDEDGYADEYNNDDVLEIRDKIEASFPDATNWG